MIPSQGLISRLERAQAERALAERLLEIMLARLDRLVMEVGS